MITFGRRKSGNGRKSRSQPKFIRGTKFLKNFEGHKLPMKRMQGWTHISISAEKIERFLLSNIGRPVNNVYSDFLTRCAPTIHNPYDTFFRNISKKEDIGRWGGFYITNGTLNYKKRKKYHNDTSHYDTSIEFNKQNFPDNQTLRLACNRAVRDGLTLLGKFYVVIDYRRGIELKNAFIRDVSSCAGFLKFESAEVLGIGRYLYKRLIVDYKGLHTYVELSRFTPTNTTSNHSVFECVIKKE